MPFLLDLFRIPADTFQLFLATGVINSRVGSLVAAVHTVTVALLATCAITGHLRWQRGPVLRMPASPLALVILVIGGTRLLFATTLSPQYSKDAVLASMQLLGEPVAATVATTPSPRAGHEPAAARNHPGTRGAARRLPARRAAVRLLQSGRRPGGLRRRARARSRARAGCQPGLCAGRSRHAGGTARRGVLRPRDVGCRRDDRPRARRCCSRTRTWTKRSRSSCRTISASSSPAGTRFAIAAP